MNEVSIDTEYIKLDQFLKYTGAAQTGGHSKMMIKNGQIKVNNEICFQRGKKLKRGDIIEVSESDTFIIK